MRPNSFLFAQNLCHNRVFFGEGAVFEVVGDFFEGDHCFFEAGDFREEAAAVGGGRVDIFYADGEREDIDVGAGEDERGERLHFVGGFEARLYEVGEEFHFVFERAVSCKPDVGDENRVLAFVDDSDGWVQDAPLLEFFGDGLPRGGGGEREGDEAFFEEIGELKVDFQLNPPVEEQRERVHDSEQRTDETKPCRTDGHD